MNWPEAVLGAASAWAYWVSILLHALGEVEGRTANTLVLLWVQGRK